MSHGPRSLRNARKRSTIAERETLARQLLEENRELRKSIAIQNEPHKDMQNRIEQLPLVNFMPTLNEHSLLVYLVDCINLAIDLQEVADDDLDPALTTMKDLIIRIYRKTIALEEMLEDDAAESARANDLTHLYVEPLVNVPSPTFLADINVQHDITQSLDNSSAVGSDILDSHHELLCLTQGTASMFIDECEDIFEDMYEFRDNQPIYDGESFTELAIQDFYNIFDAVEKASGVPIMLDSCFEICSDRSE